MALADPIADTSSRSGKSRRNMLANTAAHADHLPDTSLGELAQTAKSSPAVQRQARLQSLADQSPVAKPLQRVAEAEGDEEFEADAVIDCTETLVVRADRIFTPSNKVLEGFAGNDDKKINGKKGAVKWASGTMTGQSVMSNFNALPGGKKQSVVKSVPDDLEIVQCNNSNHAELRTTREMSNSEISAALKAVELTDMWDANVAQLKKR